MFYVYVLKSLKDGRYYIGHTSDLRRRLAEHNRGKNRSVKNKGPFRVVYQEVRATRIAAIKRERQIKSFKGGEAFKRLLSNLSNDPIVQPG